MNGFRAGQTPSTNSIVSTPLLLRVCPASHANHLQNIFVFVASLQDECARIAWFPATQPPHSTRSRYVLQHLTTYRKWLILMCLRNGMVVSLTTLPSPLSALSPSLDILPATHVPFPPPSKTSWCSIYLVLIASLSSTAVVVMPPPNMINSSVDVGFLQCSKILPLCSPLTSSTSFISFKIKTSATHMTSITPSFSAQTQWG